MSQFRRIILGLSWFVNILLLFVVLFEERVDVPVWLQVTGRMHPLLLHFPLTLLFVGIAFEFLQTREAFRQPAVRDLTSLIFQLFALTASVTALFGFFLFREGTYLGEQIELHKWLGIAVALFAVILVPMRERISRPVYYTTLTLSAVCLIAAGHVGAEVTHGQGFLTEPIRKRTGTVALVENPDSAIVYRDVIQPILSEKCISCHNVNRAKGDLILADFESMMRGGESSDVVVPGNAEKSLLYKYVTLPMEDTLHMPPKDKLQLDREEIRLIGWWINTGAGRDTKYVTLPKVDSIHPFMTTRFHPRTGLDLLNIPFVDYDEIKQLNNPYRTVQQISATRPYVAVFLGSKKDFKAEDLTDLGSVARQVVSIDLGNSQVDDDDLTHVDQFHHVQKLYLQNSNVGDAGVKNLKDLSFLEVLNLSGTKVTDRTLDEISSWKGNLKKLYVYNTSIAEESVTSLKNSKPALEVFSTHIDLSDSVYNAELTQPVVKVDSSFFRNSALIDVKLSRGKVKYYYTLDGTEPTRDSKEYSGPFRVDQSCELNVRATMEGWKDSKVVMMPLLKIGERPPIVRLESRPDPKHAGRLDSTLVDGDAGGLNRDKRYLGFIDNDLQVLFEWPQGAMVTHVAFSLLEDANKGVFLPQNVEVWVGNEKGRLSKVANWPGGQPTKDAPAQRRVITLRVPPQMVRFVRLKATRLKSLPDWYPPQNGKTSIFIDEVSVQNQ